MYLGIRTDSPVADFYLYEGERQVAHISWQADRELAKHLLSKLEGFLQDNDTSFNELKGLFVYKGPGSFTGLRIGLTVMNTAAYALSLPLVGSSGDDWINDALMRLNSKENEKITLPFYGADARITKPKK